MAVRESTLSGEAHRAPTRDLSTSSEREADDRRRILEGGSRRAIRGVAESSGERDDGWRGARGDLARPICTLPGVISTAVDEDFGMTPVEAMASGKSVLATNEGGHRETIVDGRTGFLLPPTVDAFASRISSLSDAALESMRDACIDRARQFDVAIFLAKMETALGM